MPRNAIVDTSVLVSAFLFPYSVPEQVVVLAEQGVYALHFSPIILEEVKRSLRNPRLRKSYPYTDEKITLWCDDLHKIGALITKPLPDIQTACRDPDDEHVIAAAVAARADYIVTGDKDLLILEHYQTIRIVTAKAFLKEMEVG
jgi:putative PIN family toxin of toxin-antitoxin system